MQKKGGVSESSKTKGGVIPSPGSHESATRQPRSMTKDETGTVHTKENISYNTQATFVHGRRLGGIPLKRAFRGGTIRRGK